MTRIPSGVCDRSIPERPKPESDRDELMMNPSEIERVRRWACWNAKRLCLASVILLLPMLVLPMTIARAGAPGTVRWETLRLRDTAGATVEIPPGRLTIVAFLGTECPLARLYGPRLQSIADEYSDRGVNLIGVVSNIQDSPAEIDQYAKKHQLRFPIVKDADQSVAETFGATRTPEVFIIDAAGVQRYQGRIDDQYEPGIARAKPTDQDLRRALDELLRGDPVSSPVTAGVGCLITKIKTTRQLEPSDPSVTFHRDVTPILNTHCVECHRDGEIAPMALTDYDEVVGWGQMILEVLEQGRMPPWHADPDFGHFIGERRMPAEARRTIADWVDAGMPEGDLSDRPPSPTWMAGWQFENAPDETFEMRETPYEVPPDGVVEYQYFVVNPEWTTDRWVRGA